MKKAITYILQKHFTTIYISKVIMQVVLLINYSIFDQFRKLLKKLTYFTILLTLHHYFKDLRYNLITYLD